MPGSQFGMSKDDLLEVIDRREQYPHLNIVGLHYFVGTQRKKLKHQIRELEKLRALIAELEGEHGFEVQRLEYGPGLAVPYFADDDFTDDLVPARELAPYIQELDRDVEVTVEMGRFFSASCGTYLTRVAISRKTTARTTASSMAVSIISRMPDRSWASRCP